MKPLGLKENFNFLHQLEEYARGTDNIELSLPKLFSGTSLVAQFSMKGKQYLVEMGVDEDGAINPTEIVDTERVAHNNGNSDITWYLWHKAP